MRKETLDHQRAIVDILQAEGYRVTATDLVQYGGDISDDDSDVEGVEIDFTVYVDYTDGDGRTGNRFRVK